MESEAIGGPGSDAKYRTSEEIIAAEEGRDGVNTGSGRYEVIGTGDNNSIAQRPMSIQEQYSQLTQPQSGTEAFFDLLQTLGGGAGRSKGYEAAGIMQQAQDRDQLEQVEALSLIEAQNRADAIDAQNQTEVTNQARQKELAGMEQNIQQYQQTAQQDIQKKQADLLKPLIDKAKAAIQKIAKEQGFDYVIDSTEGGSLILADGKDLMADVKVELGF